MHVRAVNVIITRDWIHTAQYLKTKYYEVWESCSAMPFKAKQTL